jgi:hypothetical protein
MYKCATFSLAAEILVAWRLTVQQRTHGKCAINTRHLSFVLFIELISHGRSVKYRQTTH